MTHAELIGLAKLATWVVPPIIGMLIAAGVAYDKKKHMETYQRLLNQGKENEALEYAKLWKLFDF